MKIRKDKYYDVSDNENKYGVMRCIQITKSFICFASDECPWKRVCVLFSDLKIGLATVEEV